MTLFGNRVFTQDSIKNEVIGREWGCLEGPDPGGCGPDPAGAVRPGNAIET